MKNIFTTIILFSILINVNAQDAFEPNENFAQSSSITYCVAFNATIDNASDVDYYTFNSINIQQMELNIFYIPSSLTLKATVYNSSLVEITNATSNPAGFLFLNFTPTSVSTFYVKIEEINNSFSADSYHFIFTNSTCLDTDGDGLLDSDETTTDPFSADTDLDGLADGREIIVFTTDPLDADTDDDGLADGLEISNTTNPSFFDSDTDGLSDGLEIGVATPISPGTSNGYSYLGTDVAAGNYFPDADGVSITNPLIADTDGGGVIDGAEDLNKNGKVDNGETDPNQSADDGTLGLNEQILNNELVIYPNPSNGIVKLVSSKKALIEVYDLTGKIVFKEYLESTNGNIIFDIHNLKTGTYLVKVIKNDRISTKKIIKK